MTDTTDAQPKPDITESYEKLAFDVHTLKNSLAANTSFTKENADGLILVMTKQAGIAEDLVVIKLKIEGLDVPALTEATKILHSMKGGIEVLGWLGKIAKWIATISAAVGILWAAAHWGPTK